MLLVPRFLAALVLLAVVSGYSHVRADIAYFPVPAVSTSKDDGNDCGLIVPILETNEEKDLTSVIAPMFIHNSILRARSTPNVFKYRRGGGGGDSCDLSARTSLVLVGSLLDTG